VKSEEIVKKVEARMFLRNKINVTFLSNSKGIHGENYLIEYISGENSSPKILMSGGRYLMMV
jgi:hypothetical protein